MRAPEKKKEQDFGFGKAAIYKIKVIGKIPRDYIDRFSNMSFQQQNDGDKTISVLTGSLPDQAALSGVMNTLYDIHMTVLSVKIINKKTQ